MQITLNIQKKDQVNMRKAIK